MSIKAMKQAYAVPLIEQLESVPTDARMMYEHDKFHHQNIPVGRLCHEAATALRQAIEQAEKQEPSLWFAIGKDGRVKYTTDSDRALKWKQAGSYRLVRNYYTAPPKREWVSLTDEEIRDLWSWSASREAEQTASTQQHAFAYAYEAKLKEKNCPSAD